MNKRPPTARDLAAMSLRDLATRYLDLLALSRHGRHDGRPVGVDQALERLAVSEAISRCVHDRRQVDILASLNAGASWRQVADVLDAPEQQLREQFRSWVSRQRELHDALRTEKPGARAIGLSPETGAAVRQLACEAGPGEWRRGRS